MCPLVISARSKNSKHIRSNLNLRWHKLRWHLRAAKVTHDGHWKWINFFSLILKFRNLENLEILEKTIRVQCASFARRIVEQYCSSTVAQRPLSDYCPSTFVVHRLCTRRIAASGASSARLRSLLIAASIQFGEKRSGFVCRSPVRWRPIGMPFVHTNDNVPREWLIKTEAQSIVNRNQTINIALWASLGDRWASVYTPSHSKRCLVCAANLAVASEINRRRASDDQRSGCLRNKSRFFCALEATVFLLHVASFVVLWNFFKF